MIKISRFPVRPQMHRRRRQRGRCSGNRFHPASEWEKKEEQLEKGIANGAFFFLLALSSQAAFLPRKMRLLNLDPRRFSVGRAAAGFFLLFSLSLLRRQGVGG